jgi:signal transduction histidine kinase
MGALSIQHHPMTTRQAFLRLCDIGLVHDGKAVLSNVGLRLLPGEIHALTGKQGAGKTSLGQIVAGLREPTAGELRINDLPYRSLSLKTARKLGICMVQRTPYLFEDLTVAENIVFSNHGLGLFRLVNQKRNLGAAADVLDRHRIAIAPEKQVRNLGVSERMLVYILKSIHQRPNLLVLDEALEELAPEHQSCVISILNELKGQGTAILWITNNIEQVSDLADRISILRNGKLLLTDAVNNIDRINLIKLSYSQFTRNPDGEGGNEEFYQLLKYNEAILRGLPVSLIVTDERRQVRMVNSHGRAQLGIGESLQPGQSVSDLLQGNAELLRLIEQSFEEKQDASGFGLSFKHGQSKRIVNLKTLPIVEGESMLGCIIMIEDISAQEKLRQQVVMSERLASVGLLASGVAHEINNPLEIMAGYLRHLRRRSQDESMAELIGELDEEVDHIKEIVSNLRTFSGDRGDTHERLDLNELLDGVINLVRFDARDKGIEVKFESCSDALFIAASRTEIRQVALNLLKNSFEAMPEGGVVTLMTEPAGMTAKLCVSDTGPGIDVEDMDDIFLPFFSTKRGGESNMGLGLSIIYGIVTNHHGTIRARNLESGGTEFTIELPLAMSGDAAQEFNDC